LFQFNTNDVGITEFVSKCWSAKKEETAKKWMVEQWIDRPIWTLFSTNDSI
jgi:hypothetical protein